MPLNVHDAPLDAVEVLADVFAPVVVVVVLLFAVELAFACELKAAICACNCAMSARTEGMSVGIDDWAFVFEETGAPLFAAKLLARARVIGPQNPAAGEIPCCSWNDCTAARVSEPKKPLTCVEKSPWAERNDCTLATSCPESLW
jgi:hypothetical protein